MICSEFYSTIAFLDKQKLSSLQKNCSFVATAAMGNELAKESPVKESYEQLAQRARDMELLVDHQQREVNRVDRENKQLAHMMEQKKKKAALDAINSQTVEVGQKLEKLSVNTKPDKDYGSDRNQGRDSGSSRGRENQPEKSNKRQPKPRETSQSAPSRAKPAARNDAAKTKLPTFSGNPEEWHYFRASFETSTAACGLSDSENLVRLRDSLQGAALERVRGLLVLPKLVPKVIDTLDRLYGNPETLFEWHLEKVRKLENPNPQKVSSCMAFAAALDQLCDLMEAMELEHQMTDSAVLEELVRKLPNMQILEWNDHAKVIKQPITLRAFSDFASKKLAQVREANPTGYRSVLKKALPDQGPKTDQANSVNTGALRREKPNLAPTDASSDKDKKEENRKRCRLCKRFGHPLWYCREFISLKVQARSVLVDSWNVCRICLGDHLIEGKQKCPHRIRCNVGKCREIHNALLHPEEAEEESDEDNNRSFDSFENVAYYDDKGKLCFVNKFH